MKYIILIIIFTSTIFPQQIVNIDGISKDTSFTVYSAAKKVKKDYPNVTVVKPDLPKGVKEKRDLIYTTIGDRKLHLDLFEPVNKTETDYPAVILIHGGGWASGSKAHLVPMAQQLAAHGYVTAAVEYRLSPEALYPAAIYDLKTAIRWMRAKAKDFNIDTNKIAVLGTSAGGQLASLLGTTRGINKFDTEGNYLQHSSDVQAVVDMDGILDFTDPAESGKDDNPAKPSAGKRWLGASFKDKPELWIEASPNIYVSEKTPPFAFINSSLPRFHAGRDGMIENLKSFNIYYEVHTIPDTPHPFWLFHPWFEEAFGYTLHFLDKVFKNK